MSIIYFLLGCSLVVALIFLVGFFRAVSGRQFDDVVTPAYRLLTDEEDNHNLPKA
jgi:cbb3-type cytochrome oxidase maturation protein